MMNDAYNALPFLNFFRGTGTGRDYYSSLPKEVQQAVDEHAGEIHSEQELRAFADKMMKKR